MKPLSSCVAYCRRPADSSFPLPSPMARHVPRPSLSRASRRCCRAWNPIEGPSVGDRFVVCDAPEQPAKDVVFFHDVGREPEACRRVEDPALVNHGRTLPAAAPAPGGGRREAPPPPPSSILACTEPLHRVDTATVYFVPLRLLAAAVAG